MSFVNLPSSTQTHNVAMTSSIAHFVLSLTNDGRVSSQGIVSETTILDEEIQKEVAESRTALEEVDAIDAQTEETKRDSADGKLVLAEEVAEGHVSWSARTFDQLFRKRETEIDVVKLYLSNLGGPFFWLIFVGGVAFTDLTIVLQAWFLGFWASQYQYHDPSEVNVS